MNDLCLVIYMVYNFDVVVAYGDNVAGFGGAHVNFFPPRAAVGYVTNYPHVFFAIGIV